MADFIWALALLRMDGTIILIPIALVYIIYHFIDDIRNLLNG